MSHSQKSWVSVPEGSHFPIQNLPFGIFDDGKGPRAGVAIGEYILDLAAVTQLGGFEGLGFNPWAFTEATLNRFIGFGKPAWQKARARISSMLDETNSEWRGKASQILVAMADARMKMPVHVGDYTDFYSSMEHATNVGIMFRGKDNALMPNWKHIPVAYHGRASSIVVSGTDLHRPKGQTVVGNSETPTFGPSKSMDFELEMAFIVGQPTSLGQSVPAEKAEDHIFGFVLFNDWSARDIQKWEYVPLGPFLGKNFGSSISPWIVTLDALEPFRVASPKQDPMPLPYLQTDGNRTFDIQLEVSLVPENGQGKLISRSNFKYLYWNICQQLAHHNINGCNLNVGDMMASGTISGPTKDSYGSLLELTWGGTEVIDMPDGSTRKFMQDNDSLVITGVCEKDGLKIGFGEVRGKLLPALV